MTVSVVTSEAYEVAGAAVGAVSVGVAAPEHQRLDRRVYTEEQAKRLKPFQTSCPAATDLNCRAARRARPVGLEFLGNWTSLTVGDFFDRVHATMPADAPGTMTPQQTSDVTAYVFKLNKFPAGTTELPTDLAALKGIKIEGAQPGK
jgi:hypothetical protein